MRKISIITPTHNISHLEELEESLLAQTYKEWEWIVLLNNGALYDSPDDRIKVYRFPYDTTNIGALKRYACDKAGGEFIIEADHDDMLTPDCVEKVLKAFEDEETGFVYSKDAILEDNFKPYDPSYGWTYTKYNWKGKELYSMDCHPVYPGRLGYIWFAPDHVRAWRKSVYDNMGGHSFSLSVCDDQELMHKMYLSTRFKYIPEVLYIYRINGENTWIQKNKVVQEETQKIYDQNIYKLSERFADINGLMKIDLCGGFGKLAGYTSIDKFGGDIVHDLENGIPLPDNSCGVIRAHDALEHIKNQQLIMAEIHRVLAPGGILLSQTPSTDGRGAWQDPTHVSFWNENSFWYWTRKEQAQYIRNNRMFRECRLTTAFPDDWCRRNNIPYVIAHLEKLSSEDDISHLVKLIP
jgi:glycosyltransferase involved in cell wall biosynthesis